MKKCKVMGLMLIGGMLLTTPVYAQKNATVEFHSDSKVTVGDIFTVDMEVTNVTDTEDGVVSLGGNLSFDQETLKYLSSKAAEKPYLFQMNENYNYKIAGLDFTLDNGIKQNTVVYTFTFEALKEGNTQVTLTNQKLTDSKSYIETNVKAKNIEILPKQEPTIETSKVSLEENDKNNQSIPYEIVAEKEQSENQNIFSTNSNNLEKVTVKKLNTKKSISILQMLHKLISQFLSL